MTGILLDPSVISQMHSKHLLLTVCKTNIALDIPYLLALVQAFWATHNFGEPSTVPMNDEAGEYATDDHHVIPFAHPKLCA